MSFNKSDKKRNRIIAIIMIMALLVFAYWYGGGAPGLQGWEVKSDKEIVREEDNSFKDEEVLDIKDEEIDKNSDAEDELKDKLEIKDELKGKKDISESENKDSKVIKSEKDNKKLEKRPGGIEGGLSAAEKLELAKEISGGQSVEKGSKDYAISKGMNIDEKTGKDKYLTDPVPEGKPIPVEPQNSKITDIPKKAILSVRCDTILDNLDWLNPEKVELVPKDGVIYARREVTFYEGESVFNLLLREMKKNKIHMEFSNTPMYNSVYIEGINNLYEFDCGELSGWMYKVNDWFPNYGASRYQLKDGDVVEWVYTCNLGVDVGGYAAIGGE